MMLALLLLATRGAGALRIEAPARPGGLADAQSQARAAIAARPAEDVEVVLQPGRHALTTPLSFGPADSGEPGRFRVVWSAADPENTTMDGGVAVPGPWVQQQAVGAFAVWAAPLPAAALKDARSIRQLYAGGKRLARTRANATALGLPEVAKKSPSGFELASELPLSWKEGAELVSDHTWVQHRCPVTAVQKLQLPPAPPPAPVAKGTCTWSPKTAGHSPGSSLKRLPATNYAACQAECCKALPKCEGIIFNEFCYLLNRKYERGFSPGSDGFVADLNCSHGVPPTCPGVAPPPPMRVRLTMGNDCWAKATAPGALGLSFASISFFENTGLFTEEGQFYIDAKNHRVLVSGARPAEAVLSVTQTLLQSSDAHDIEWNGLTFAHSGWGAPSTEGIVERYGGTLFALGADAPYPYVPSPAAVMIADSRDVSFNNCSFERLGAWGLRLYNGTQRAEVRRCRFHDLSGGGICVGNVNDTPETRPERQMAGIVLADNTLTNLSAEYKGAPGIHSFCMRQSSIEHNLIREVGYTGLSYNWPSPQGPTFGGASGDGNASVGYSADNLVVGNDVSRYMSYMMDGGGIHTIGKSLNTSVSRNYFHDLASGEQCGDAPCHSVRSQSSIYIDNWSAGFTIDDNVVVNTAHTVFGWIFFQYFASKGGVLAGATAHDNTAHGNTVCNSGPPPQPRDPLDETNGTNVTGTVNVSDCAALPPAAAAIVAAAGPR